MVFHPIKLNMNWHLSQGTWEVGKKCESQLYKENRTRHACYLSIQHQNIPSTFRVKCKLRFLCHLVAFSSFQSEIQFGISGMSYLHNLLQFMNYYFKYLLLPLQWKMLGFTVVAVSRYQHSHADRASVTPIGGYFYLKKQPLNYNVCNWENVVQIPHMLSSFE